MSVSFNFPDLNTTNWKPVNFETVGDDYVSKFNIIKFQDGSAFGLNECLKNFKDVSFNKKTGMFLTDIGNTVDFLEYKNSQEEVTNLTQIFSPIAAIDYEYDRVVTLSNSNTLSATYRNAADISGTVSGVGTTDNFTFIFSTDKTHVLNGAEENFVSVETSFYNKYNKNTPDQYLLSWNSLDNSLVFKPKIFPESSSQKFSYLLSNNGIVLFKPDSNFSVFVDRNPVTSEFEFKNFLDDPQDFLPVSSFLKFVSFSFKDLGSSDIKNSHLSKYIINKLDYQQEIVPDKEVNNLPYSQNFLGIFPVEKPTLKEKHATYSLQFHGLKNYQTPEYNYSFNKNYIEGFSGVHRIYDHIFSGTNQKEGLMNVHLGYTANTSEMVFPKDRETAFNFASTSYRIPLSSAGLIEDGAIPGHHPFVSDRIYLKQMDYSGQIQGIPQPPSLTNFSNTWLCAWLSGSNSDGAIWMDRFYNPAYYTFDQALSSSSPIYSDRMEEGLNYIYDVPSSLYLEPGAFYRYYHSGSLTSQKYLPFLDGNINSPLGSKVLHISSWDQSSLEDNSYYKNNGLVYPVDYRGQNTDYWSLDGNNHAIFPSKASLLEEHHLSASLWIKVNDWSNIQGNQIFGNYYNSGFGLINETSLAAPLISIADLVTGQLYNFNYKFKIVNYSQLSKNDETNNFIICRLLDHTYWVFDTVNGTGSKYDIEGRKLITLEKKYFKINQIEVDENSNIYIFQSYKKRVVVLNSEGVLISSLTHRCKRRTTARIELFKYQNKLNPQTSISVIEIFGNASTIDNEGNIWQSMGKNLYKSTYDSISDKHSEPVYFATLGLTQQITCDVYNNIWILHDQDKISILKPNQKLFKTFRMGARKGLPEDPCFVPTGRFRYINFVKTPESGSLDCVNYQSRDMAVLLDSRDNELMLLDLNGDLLTKLNLNTLHGLNTNSPVFCANGDFTGYQLLRKFKHNTKNIGWKIRISDSLGKYQETITLNYNNTLLHPGWHHFAMVFDAENGTASYYIDSVLVDQQFIDKTKQIWYDYRSSLLLGINSVKNSNLNDLINIQNAYKFIGDVADLRVYNKSLTKGDIEQIYFSFKFSDNRKPLIWNMLTGKRNYIEGIKHWFQLQLPGSKSKYFNINIHNLKAEPEIQILIEDAIRKNIAKLAPAYTSLYKINWL